jgi:hypothetical protein
MKNRLCMVALVAVAAVLWGTVAPAQAEGFAPRKKIYGYVSLGAGALLLKGA